MSSFSSVFHELLAHGQLISPRGQKTLELENFQQTFLPYERFATFPSRKLSLDYIKTEIQWYLNGDAKDLSICDHAKIWLGMVGKGKINSNYGQYIFREYQLDHVVDVLRLDPASRRAYIVILRKTHLHLGNPDVPCTLSLGFRIRDNELRCGAVMRSTDAIFGLCNDVPFFSFVQELIFEYLRQTIKGLEMGPLVLFSASMHCYERHWEMLDRLAAETLVEMDCPRLQGTREIEMLRYRPYYCDAASPPFTRWLNARDKKKEGA